jgi:3',5'-cyclic AMP phosphodiesterase CpdA
VTEACADILREAADLNRRDTRRDGNTVALGGGCEVVVAGDLHGHRRNLERILAYADLANRPHRRLILQEIIHGPPDRQTGHDLSVEVLVRAARAKVDHPRQVLFLLGNHDVAQATGREITKAGHGVCRAFVEGVRHAVGREGTLETIEALDAFLLSMPIAVRTPGDVLICHTLPTPQRMHLAGEDVPDGPYDESNLRRGGSVYEWTWGRNQTPEQVDRLADRLGVTFFVLGHRHIRSGYELIGRRAIILTAEHDRGCVLCLPSDAPLTAEDVPGCLRPIARLGERA